MIMKSFKRYISIILFVSIIFTHTSCDRNIVINETEYIYETSNINNRRIELEESKLQVESQRVNVESKPSSSKTSGYYNNVSEYFINKDLSNIENWNQFSFTDDEKSLLAENGFLVKQTDSKYFYESYSDNNINQIPNFITIDAMFHMFNSYISYLKVKLINEHLSDILLRFTHEMLDESKIQYELFRGTKWEHAAKRNVAFFTVALSLQEDCIPEEYVENDIVVENYLMKEGKVSAAAVSIGKKDYSLFTPKGIYAENEKLSKYYRAMTWYKLMSYPQVFDDFFMSTILMTLAEDNAQSNYYDIVYSLTSFTNGFADDLSCFDTKKILNAIYEEVVTNKEDVIEPDDTIKQIIDNNNLYGNDSIDEKYGLLLSDDEILDKFKECVKNLDVKKQNYISYEYYKENNIFVDMEDEINTKMFRFMPRDFSIEDYILNMLTDRDVPNREVPDILDIFSVFGSTQAERIMNLDNTKLYAYYAEHIYKMRDNLFEINNLGELNLHNKISTASQINNIGYTGEKTSKYIDSGGVAAENVNYYLLKSLRPIIYDKPYTTPWFMSSNAWRQKELETFSGVYTELKSDFDIKVHFFAEGEKRLAYKANGVPAYVQPEPHIYKRLSNIVYIIKNGLEKYNMIDEKEEDNLNKLRYLCEFFQDCSDCEIEGVVLSKSNFDEINHFGEDLKYFEDQFINYILNMNGENSLIKGDTEIFPTYVDNLLKYKNFEHIMQIALGTVSNIYAVVPINGLLRIVTGPAYSFYQFKNINDKKINSKIWSDAIVNYNGKGDMRCENIATSSSLDDTTADIAKPSWTRTYTR